MPPDDHHYICLFHAFEWQGDHLFTSHCTWFLQLWIQQYLEQFTSLYPHWPLTPKCHYLVHIPTLTEKFGYLLCIIMCTAFSLAAFLCVHADLSMRFEGKQGIHSCSQINQLQDHPWKISMSPTPVRISSTLQKHICICMTDSLYWSGTKLHHEL